MSSSFCETNLWYPTNLATEEGRFDGRYTMRFLLKVIALTMIAVFPFTTNVGTYLDLHKALLFKQYGQYGKAYPILPQLAEMTVRAQMELADMYVMGQDNENNDEAIYWACRAAQSGEFRALKFRIVSIENNIR